jgi:1-deoxy-D-xylulose-5-phosphate synthase
MVPVALKAADLLSSQGVEATVVNARFVKPMDKKTLQDVATRIKKIITLEEGVSTGGFGSAVLEALERENLRNVTVKTIGLPDRFIVHGKRDVLLKKYRMTPEGVAEIVKMEIMRRYSHA